MYRLSEQQRAAIVKTSDTGLRATVVQAGYQSRDVEGLDRPRLVEMMAALISEEEAGVVRAEAAVAAESDLANTAEVSDTERTVVAEMSLKERQLTLTERELEERRQARLLEMDERRQARLLEEKRLEQEQKKLELEERKLDQERMLKKKEIEWKESPANKHKLWGDALRNAVSRMPVEPMDIASWFKSPRSCLSN